MLLAIDIGNTNVTLAVFPGTKVHVAWRLATDPRRTADDYAAALVSLMQEARVTKPDLHAAAIASVVPALTDVFETVCTKHLEVKCLTIGPGTPKPISVRVDNPLEVGTDRVVNAAAGHVLYGRDDRANVIVVDFGTATKFDAVTASGDFLGGAIAAGADLSAEALFLRAAKLPRIPRVFPQSVIGTNTVHAMQAGLFAGHLALAEGLLARMKTELGAPVRVIATGGLSSVIAPQLQGVFDRVDPHLTLQGVRIIHEHARLSK